VIAVSEVTQLLDRLGLFHYQTLANNGLDSLSAYTTSQNMILSPLDIELGDRRTLLQEIRRRRAQDDSGGLVASSTNSLRHDTPGTEASAVASNDESAGALSHPELKSIRHCELL
jgi:hypothetical protein